MVCWLKFLQRVSDALRGVEPELSSRKRLAIEVLRDLEKEKGHNVEEIGKALDELGVEGIIKRAEERKKGKKKKRSAQICEECEIEETVQSR